MTTEDSERGGMIRTDRSAIRNNAVAAPVRRRWFRLRLTRTGLILASVKTSWAVQTYRKSALRISY